MINIKQLQKGTAELVRYWDLYLGRMQNIKIERVP